VDISLENRNEKTKKRREEKGWDACAKASEVMKSKSDGGIIGER